MPLTLTWDLFILVFIAVITAYSFIIGKHQTLKVLVAVYVAILATQGIGNILGRFADPTEPVYRILRVMGVSKTGVFSLVFLRAAAIGLVAGGLTILVGLFLAWLLRLVQISIVFQPLDLVVVFGSALACCVVGSLYPAWDASRVDPFDAIIEGKFR